jgi:ligand-binding sensor domain-containing protein
MNSKIKFLVLVLFIPVQISLAQQNQIFFEQLNLAEGLSHSLVSGGAEDQSGFMWFATQDGIDRYDGYGFKVYQSGKGPRFPSASWITSMYMDHQAQMWIVFQGKGISRFDTKTEMFYEYNADPDKPGAISDTQIQPLTTTVFNVFYEDISGNLWIGSQNGLNLYNRPNDNFRVFRHDPRDPNSLSDDRIVSLAGDSKGNIWVGTRNGLNLLDPSTGKAERFSSGQLSSSISDTTIRIIFAENDSTIWIGTPFGGLNLLQFSHNHDHISITHLLTRSVIKNEEATINSIYKTRTGKILVGMIGGLYEIKHSDRGWTAVPFKKTLNYAIEGIIEDPEGNVWVSGSISKNIFRFNPDMTVCDEIPLLTKSINESKNIKYKQHRNFMGGDRKRRDS